MEPSCGRADVFGHGGGERNHVVLGDLLDFLDAGHVESAALPDVARRVRRDNPRAGHGFGSGRFNLQPGLVLPLIAPDATHVRARVPFDHRRDCDRLNRETPRTYPSDSLSGGSCKPLTAPSTVADSAPCANRSRATRCTSSALTCSTPLSVSSSPTCLSK